ncbi:hypothetical protein ZWY2020_042661 [Hordeum vulgare]|nr:hypothetical protein ZWY2020_042661 [Hordeum vulgare]
MEAPPDSSVSSAPPPPPSARLGLGDAQRHCLAHSACRRRLRPPANAKRRLAGQHVVLPQPGPNAASVAPVVASVSPATAAPKVRKKPCLGPKGEAVPKVKKTTSRKKPTPAPAAPATPPAPFAQAPAPLPVVHELLINEKKKEVKLAQVKARREDAKRRADLEERMIKVKEAKAWKELMVEEKEHTMMSKKDRDEDQLMWWKEYKQDIAERKRIFRD